MKVSRNIPPDDELFHTSIRLTIMLLLVNHRKIGFSELQKLLHMTPGNLNHHVKKLEEAEYVRTRKSLLSGRALTVIEITEHGDMSFRKYICELKKSIQVDTG
ncbi:MAG: transcriptional regulator [Candidatus Hodarchaeales archaeon]|jgi:DNA-binding MarR family transcriptional regulator